MLKEECDHSSSELSAARPTEACSSRASEYRLARLPTAKRSMARPSSVLYEER